MDRRKCLAILLGSAVVAPQVAKDTLVGVVEAGIHYASRQAEAAERKVWYDVGEYYDSGVASDEMPGAMKCPGDVIKNKALGFRGNLWFDYFFRDSKYSSQLDSIFKGLDGERIIIFSPEHSGESVEFDYLSFRKFSEEQDGNVTAVTFWNDGFMSFDGYQQNSRLLIPMSKEVILRINKL